MKLATFLRQGAFLSSSLSKIKGHIEKLLTDITIGAELVDQAGLGRLEFYQKEAESKYAEFKSILKQLMSCDENDACDVEQVLSIEDEISQLILSIQVLINPYVNKPNSQMNESVPSVSSASSQNLKLPPLSLKTFNGSPDQWLSFFNLFEASVDQNSEIGDTHKMQYLLSSLQGEPLNLIKNLQITPENYQVAWNLLKKRYQNNRKIVSFHANNIIDLPQILTPTANNLRAFISRFHENDQALLALKHEIKEDNIILPSLLLRKLDNKTRKRFEDSRPDSQQFPNSKELITFLEKECINLEASSLSHSTSSHCLPLQSSIQKTSTGNSQNMKVEHSKYGRTVLISHPKLKCNFCSSTEHSIYTCPSFKEVSVQNKFNFVKEKRFCFNCLGSAHSVKECKSKNVCSHCHKKHHTWLHLPGKSTSSESPLVPNDERVSKKPVENSNSSKNALVALTQNEKPTDRPSTILLGTTLVHVKSSNGNSLVIRAVVDSASMISCITESTANLLSLERSSHKYNQVDGLSSCHVKTKGLSKLNISALNGTQITNDHPIVILDRITSSIPHTQVPQDVKDKFSNLVLADPTFDTPSSIDMLLGADIYAKIMTGERLIISDNLPAAMNSVFGYIIIGSSPALEVPPDSAYAGLTSLLSSDTFDLHQAVQRFWTHEEPPLKVQPTPEELFCENHFTNNHSRDETGRYIVRLPLKKDHPSLGDTSEIAKRRFYSLEKKLNSNPDLKKQYIDGMNDYLNSGDMEIVTSIIPQDKEHFFLPHHAVIKEESSSTKVRIVFDASARSSTGISLNDILHCGPKLQNEISDILLYFRSYPYVCCSDIRQMFRRIFVHPDDRNYQLLYWRDNPSKPLSIYRLTTVVFGFSSSPYLAIRTLKQLVKDEGHIFPTASQAIEKQIYVDDLILGADNLDSALTLQSEAIQLLSKGGFDLRKWSSNHPQLVRNVPESHREKPLFCLDSKLPTYNVLGVKWNPENDEFVYRLNLPETDITKRHILSTVARIYDICGWLTPVTFWTKSLLQLLWSLGVQWDEPVPSDVADKWKKFISHLPILNTISIPRYVSLHDAIDIQLHGFCDGSEAGYGAVVYIRCVAPDNSIKVFLLIAKSRVSPLKRISIPRLELCGAHLLANLIHYTTSILSQRCRISSVKAWSDSSVVLSWIQTPAYRLKVFVANRVAQIQDLTPAHIWSHISTHSNPADCASRGLLPSSLPDHELWWQGPLWLRQHQETWPTPVLTPIKTEELPDIKAEPLPILITAQPSHNELLLKYSSWQTLLRVFAFVLRFIKNSREQPRETGFLKLDEVEKAKVKICQLVQQSAFQEDLSRLKSGKTCTSRMCHLSPFIDEMGLIRVGGRLQHSNLTHTIKHPIILPKSHHVTNLIIDYFHIKYLHAGPHFLQATLSQTFWILSSRSVIRSRIFKCVRCSRCKPKLINQKMGQLPQSRVLPSRVFSNCGTDFAGPFLVKQTSLRKASHIKVYICLFICFSVKAVHVEVVSDLTSEAFIAALTRFVSRRGLCANIYCDCGTNFVGANSELEKIKKFLSEEKTKESLDKFSNQHEMKFHFLPPAAPHQGGLWERAVRSIKHHLRRAIGNQILTLEEFMTLSIRVEAILNSRPLTPLSSDPSELDCLTPGHFLIGAPLVAPPEYNWNETPYNRLSRWQLVQSLGQSIWKRWKLEYLHTLQQRAKWTKPQSNIKEGDIVIIHDPNEPPMTWKLGRVSAVSPGPDGLVRVVQLQTANGKTSRPITKISPLIQE